MARPEAVVAVDDLGQDGCGRPLREARREQPARAIRAPQRAAARGQDREPPPVAEEIERGRRQRVGSGRIRGVRRAAADDFGQRRQESFLGRAGDDEVGPRFGTGVAGAEGRIDPAEDDGNGAELAADEVDDRLDPRIPVGHARGHQDGVRTGQSGKLRLEQGHGEAVAREPAGDAADDFGLGDLLFRERAAAIGLAGRMTGQAGMEAVQAVDERHAVRREAADE